MSNVNSLDFLNQFYHSLSNPKEGVEIRDRSWRLRSYPKTFIGSEAVVWISKKYQLGKPAAILLGEKMRALGCFDHVVSQHSFQDEFYFYHMKPFKDFSGNCLKFLSKLHLSHDSKNAELTKDEFCRHLTKEDIQSVIYKNRIYIDEKKLSRKSLSDFSVDDCTDLFKNLTIDQLRKSITPETTEKMSDVLSVIKRMSLVNKREALKGLYNIILQYEHQKEDGRVLTDCLVQLQNVVTLISISKEELALYLKTKEEIIKNSNDWMRLIFAVPNETLKYFAKLVGKENLVPQKFSTFRLELTTLETLLHCLPKKEIIKASLQLFKKEQELVEREAFGKLFMAQRTILFGLLEPKKFDDTLKKFMKNPKIAKYLKEIDETLTSQELLERIGETQNIIAFTLCMMRTQDVMFLAVPDLYAECFNIDLQDLQQLEAYIFFCNYHNLSQVIDIRSKLLADLSEAEMTHIVGMIPDNQYREIRMYHEIADRNTTMNLETCMDILKVVPIEELENYVQFVKTKSKKRVSKLSHKHENFITIFDYFYENGFDAQDLLGSLQKLMPLLEMEKQSHLSEFNQISGKTKDTKEVSRLESILQQKHPLWIRYRGFLIGIVRDYKWIDGEIYLNSQFVDKCTHLRFLRWYPPQYDLIIGSLQFPNAFSFGTDVQQGKFTSYNVRIVK